MLFGYDYLLSKHYSLSVRSFKTWPPIYVSFCNCRTRGGLFCLSCFFFLFLPFGEWEGNGKDRDVDIETAGYTRVYAQRVFTSIFPMSYETGNCRGPR